MTRLQSFRKGGLVRNKANGELGTVDRVDLGASLRDCVLVRFHDANGNPTGDGLTMLKTQLEVIPKEGEANAKLMAHVDRTKKIVIVDAEQIASLPWLGNHACDSGLFDIITKFIMAQTDREVQKRAIRLMGKHGMGIDEPVSDADLEQWLAESAA